MTTAIAITTRQNVANVLPAVQLGVSRYVALESDTARRHAWGQGAKRVLERHLPGIQILDGDLPDGPDPVECARVALQILDSRSEEDQVFWVLGGGLKAQQVGLWMAYQMRRDWGAQDQMIYADPDHGALQFLTLPPWNAHSEDAQIQEDARPLRSRLTIEDIVACNDPEISVEPAEKSAHGMSRRASEFERDVARTVSDLLARLDPARELFVDRARNIEFKKRGSTLGEHDVLLATSAGTLLSLDAKSGLRKSQDPRTDWPARQQRFRTAGGVLSNWVAVLPSDFSPERVEELSEVAQVVFLNSGRRGVWVTLEDFLRDQAARLKGP